MYAFREKYTDFGKQFQAITIKCDKNKENGLGRNNDKSF